MYRQAYIISMQREDKQRHRVKHEKTQVLNLLALRV
jgi:hypothetical protein